MNQIALQVETQTSPVADEVSALMAVVRPILQGLLFGLKSEVVAECGGLENIRLFMLPRVYRPGYGDCGICFEYAAHDAINRKVPSVVEKVSESLARYCRVPGSDTASILFGAEKTGALQVIGSPANLLTDESRVLTGVQAQPPKLKQYIQTLTDAFRRSSQRELLPSSISGLWKADLFLGNRDSDRWVGTTVKINRAHLEGAAGLRIGIVPARHGSGDGISFDDAKNLVICPLPYDGEFMEIFYTGWTIVQQFLAADAKVPPPASLPIGAHIMVAKFLEDRRDFPVLEVISAMVPVAQPGLLQTHNLLGTTSIQTATAQDAVQNVIAPQPMTSV
ncbi:hypothetical protein [Achromobacter denitrificans]|uniref:hypothetical protein n=1 Tax=Achromobacter denitrificans TaxID=32002 RepID=UPI0011250D00|nr:hypothetical protein [Achromobacter denitrificans]